MTTIFICFFQDGQSRWMYKIVSCTQYLNNKSTKMHSNGLLPDSGYKRIKIFFSLPHHFYGMFREIRGFICNSF